MHADRIRRYLLPVVGLALLVLAWHFYVVWFPVPLAVLPSPLMVLDAIRANLPPAAGGLDHLPRKPARLPACLRARGADRGRGFELADPERDVLSDPDRDPVVAQGRARSARAGVARPRDRIQARDRLAGGVLPDRRGHGDGTAFTPAEYLDLATSVRANAWQTFYKIRFPAALPFVISGSKVAITLAVIGAVIGEFVGSTEGLGNLLLVANSQINTPLAFAALVGLSILGIGLYGAVVLVDSRSRPGWARPISHVG